MGSNPILPDDFLIRQPQLLQYKDDDSNLTMNKRSRQILSILVVLTFFTGIPWNDLPYFYYEWIVPGFIGELYGRLWSIDELLWFYLIVIIFLIWDSFFFLVLFFFICRRRSLFDFNTLLWWATSFVFVFVLFGVQNRIIHWTLGNFIQILTDFAQQGFLFELPILKMLVVSRVTLMLFDFVVICVGYAGVDPQFFLKWWSLLVFLFLVFFLVFVLWFAIMTQTVLLVLLLCVGYKIFVFFFCFMFVQIRYHIFSKGT